jgi:hypothetical protein
MAWEETLSIGMPIAYLLSKVVLPALQSGSTEAEAEDLPGALSPLFGVMALRSYIINKILSLQYRLGKVIGRKKAAQVCILMERGFSALFGRESYRGKD